MYVAHRADDGRLESVADHLRAVSDMAAAFADEFGSADCGRLVGLLHDAGKYSDGFQRRIMEDGPKVDHSAAGALRLFNPDASRPSALGVLLSYCIAGHHAGLPDGGSKSDSPEGPTLYARLRRCRQRGSEWWDRAEDEGLELMNPSCPAILSVRGNGFTWAFWTRMLFSSLVDADFLCTEEFMQGSARKPVSTASLASLRDVFEARVAQFFPPQGKVNETRCDILEACRKAAAGPKGFYSLTVPTGGGKTLASMRFALHHAAQNECARRIIYAVPYTSIIEQNAQVFRDWLGAQNVLEHHSGFDFDAQEDNQGLQSEEALIREKLRLASENWDAPVVVTTNVQLFESLFANRTSKCRKLHNIANSIIVLDEAQMLPTAWLEPCLAALRELVEHYGCTVLFCTATQPALSIPSRGIPDIREICPNVADAFEKLKRVSFDYAGTLSDDDLAQRLLQHSQVLCIVNSRKQAKALYDLLAERDSGVFHLSTLMHAEHRKKTIASIRQRLVEGLPCRVVSTSLVEAGVDLDFPMVYRALSGLDSVVQAAGRCNREGKRPACESCTVIFESSEGYRVPADVKQRAEICRGVLRDVDFFAAESARQNATSLDDAAIINEYFKRLYSMRKGGMDKDDVCRQLEKSGVATIPFREVAEKFKLIDEPSFPIVIPCEEIKRELEEIRAGRGGRKALRKLARYSVSVYEHSLKELSGAVVAIGPAGDLYELCFPEKYKSDSGLELSAAQGEAVML